MLHDIRIKILKNIFILIILTCNLLFANATVSLQEQYQDAKVDYLKAVLKKDEQLKISELKKIIELGDKLNKDTRPDKKKLDLLLEKQPNIQEKGPDFPNKVVKKDVEKNSTVLENSKNLLYSIQSVTSSSNEIIIDF